MTHVKFNQQRSISYTVRNNESGLGFYLYFIPQVVNFNNKGTNHGPHNPKEEQDKSPQNNQKCDFGGHLVSPYSKLEQKFTLKHRSGIEIRFQKT